MVSKKKKKKIRVNKTFVRWFDEVETYRTYNDLAVKMGLTRGCIWSWYHGRYAPSLERMAELEKISRRQVPMMSWLGAGV